MPTQRPAFHSHAQDKRLCPVCHQKIMTRPGRPDEDVCSNFDCIRLIQQRNTVPPLLYQSLFRTQSRQIREKLRKSRETAERQEKVDALIQDEDLKTLLAHDLPPDTIIVSTGSGDGPSTPLPASRRQRFEASLNLLRNKIEANDIAVDAGERRVARQFESIRQRFGQHTTLEDKTHQICANCRGSCCHGGQEHAYLSPHTLQTTMRQRQVGLDKVVTLYMDALPKTSVKDSCVFHTDKGCHLPDDMRSIVCKGYLCAPLLDYHRLTERAGGPGTTRYSALAISHAYIQFRKYDAEAPASVLRVRPIN